MSRTVAAFLSVTVLCGCLLAQQKAPKTESPAKLELDFDIAATDDNGYPSALRITVKNVGGVPVYMPVLKSGCSPDNGISVRSLWIPDDPSPGLGGGMGCGISDQPTLFERVRHEWVCLRPGEYMTDTERLRWDTYEKEAPGTAEYWVEYEPPLATDAEVASLLQKGYAIPTEKLETTHSSFHIN